MINFDNILLEENKNKFDYALDAKIDSYKTINDYRDIDIESSKNKFNSLIKQAKDDIEEAETYKKPNILVRLINSFRNLYTKFMYKYRMLERNNNEKYQNKSIFKRILYRITNMIDRLTFKLQKLLDRRNINQMSKDEKMNYAIDSVYHNSPYKNKLNDKSEKYADKLFNNEIRVHTSEIPFRHTFSGGKR